MTTESAGAIPVVSLHWSEPLVGLPYADKGRSLDGIDCWGTVYLAFRDIVGKPVPSYAEGYVSAVEAREVRALLTGLETWPWRPVELGQERDFDVAFFRPAHVGLVTGPGEMLHVMAGEHSRIEGFMDGRWRHRLIGIVRHVELA